MDALDEADAADATTDSATDAATDAPTTPIFFYQGNSLELGAVEGGTVPLGTSHAGDLVVLVLSYDLVDAGAPVVTDSLGDTYQVAIGPVPGQGFTRYLDYAEDIPTGALTISIALPSPPGSSFQVYALEYSGIVATDALDVTSWEEGSSAGAAAMRSGAKTTHFPHELIFGYGESGTVTAGKGFRLRENLNSNVAEDSVVKSVGSYQATATTAGGGWIMMMATFVGH